MRSEGWWSLKRCSAIQKKNLVPVLHRTNVVIHHRHGVPVRQETRYNLREIPTLTPVINTRAASVDSHNPYSRDGEGRKADRQDDPGGHWAGEELPLSQAWGDTGASDRRHDRRQRDRDRETGWGVGVANTKGNTLGWTSGGETKRAMPQLVCSAGPSTQQSKDFTEDQQPDVESVQ